MPLIDILLIVEEMLAFARGPDRVVAHFDPLILAAIDTGAHVPRHELPPEADTQIGLLLLERHADPLGFRLDEGQVVIGAHGPTEDDGRVVVFHAGWKGIAERGAANIELASAPDQRRTDPAGTGPLLMEHNENAACHGC